jgi:pseudaminic acid synthase
MKRKNNLTIKIGKQKIGAGFPVFIVAEISGNHNGSFKRAKDLVKAACESGADAIKLQTYTPDTLTIDSTKKYFQVKTNPAWKGKILYELYKEAYTPWNWQPELKKIAESYRIPLFSTPFDKSAVDFLEKLKIPVYKIASFETGDIELLKKVASTKKPVIISRGITSFKELALAISTLKENGSSSIAILHCISSYPARPEEMNLSTIPAIRKRFNVVTGISDHSLGISAAIASVVLGASIIEKHFTLKRSDGGPDAAFSLEPHEFKNLIKSVRETEKAIGTPQFTIGKEESKNIIFRRSLFITKNIKIGQEFTRENVRCIRPGYGLSCKYLPKVLNKKAAKNIEKGTPLSWKLIS